MPFQFCRHCCGDGCVICGFRGYVGNFDQPYINQPIKKGKKNMQLFLALVAVGLLTAGITLVLGLGPALIGAGLALGFGVVVSIIEE